MQYKPKTVKILSLKDKPSLYIFNSEFEMTYGKSFDKDIIAIGVDIPPDFLMISRNFMPMSSCIECPFFEFNYVNSRDNLLTMVVKLSGDLDLSDLMLSYTPNKWRVEQIHNEIARLQAELKTLE